MFPLSLLFSLSPSSSYPSSSSSSLYDARLLRLLCLPMPKSGDFDPLLFCLKSFDFTTSREFFPAERPAPRFPFILADITVTTSSSSSSSSFFSSSSLLLGLLLILLSRLLFLVITFFSFSLSSSSFLFFAWKSLVSSSIRFLSTFPVFVFLVVIVPGALRKE